MSSNILNNNKVKKTVKYTNKDFTGFRDELVDFAKIYYPDTYNDFNESSPGMMFIEMSAAIGDVLSYYTDVQLRESLLVTVEENLNLYNIAHSLGYTPKFRTPASVNIDIFQVIPSINSGSATIPDFRYALQIDSGAVFSSTGTSTFRSIDGVDFSYSSSLDPTDISVYSIDGSGEVDFFLLKKKVKAVSGNIRSRDFTFTTPKPYDKIVLTDANLLEVIDITDSDGNRWYQTPYLAQDLIPISLPNMPYNDPVFSRYRSSVPYLLQFKQTDKRYVVRTRENSSLEIQFGSGVSSEYDEEIVPNPFNVGFGLDYFERVVDLSIDPKNFLYTKTYGRAPSNTTLTVRYSVGGGLSDNVGANSINSINSINVLTLSSGLDGTLYNTVVSSLAINNSEPARGGLSNRKVEDMRRDALANFSAQNRAVTKEDYIIRCYSMPVKYGAIAKVCIEVDDLIVDGQIDNRYQNYFGINLYVLGYDNNKNFVPLNEAVKHNLINYLKQYRMLTDSVNIKEPFIINIAIYFEIIVDELYNSNEVLLMCINRLKDMFDNDRMGIGKPIFKSIVLRELALTEGVISVSKLEFYNKYDTSLGYSGNVYDLGSATKNGVIYTSLDQSVFEVKYPNKDIRGRVINF